MSTPYLKCSYTRIEAPIELIERASCCGATDYYHIAYVTTDHAQLLHDAGIRWLGGEPDWTEHFKKLDLMQAKKMKRDAEKRIKELENE